MRTSLGKSEIDPTAAEVTSVSAVCLCRGSFVAMKQKERDQGGRKGLMRRAQWKERGRTRREKRRGNPQEPESCASSHRREQLMGEGAIPGGSEGQREGYSQRP